MRKCSSHKRVIFFLSVLRLERKDLCDSCLNEITDSVFTQHIRGEVSVEKLFRGNRKCQTEVTFPPTAAVLKSLCPAAASELTPRLK